MDPQALATVIPWTAVSHSHPVRSLKVMHRILVMIMRCVWCKS